MSIWRSILNGIGSRVGGAIAEKGLQELTAGEREEAERAAKARRLKWLAGGGIVVSVVGLLFVSGLFADLLRWLFGAAFVAGIVGGTYYLGRNRFRALKAKYDEDKTERIEASKKVDAQRRVEEQLAELKKKKKNE